MSITRRFAALGAALAFLLPAAAHAGPAVWVDSLPVPDQAVTYMSAFPGGEAFVYFDNRDSVSISNDYGLSWIPSPFVPTTSGVFEMADAKTGYLGSGSELWQTRDGALTWRSLPKVTGAGGDVDIHAISPVGGRLTLGGSLPRRNKGRCHRIDAAVAINESGGISGRYRTTKLGFPGHVERLGWLNKKIGWALAFEMRPSSDDPCNGLHSRSKRVLITRDGGKTYDEVHICKGAFGQEGDGYCTAVAMSDARTVLVGKTNGWIYISKNGGYGFEPAQQLSPPGLDQTYTHWVSGIEFADSRTGYAVGKGGGAWRTDDGGETWTYEGSSQQTWGIAVGDIAVADAEHAIAGGPNSIVARKPLP